MRRARGGVRLAPSRGSPVMWATAACPACAGRFRGPPGLCPACEGRRQKAIAAAEAARRRADPIAVRPVRVLPL